MFNVLSSVSNNEYEVSVWENDGKFTVEVVKDEQDENASVIAIDKSDILDIVRQFANVSTELAKEMINEIVDTF